MPLPLKGDGYGSPRQPGDPPRSFYWFVLLTLAVTVAAFAPGTSSRSTVRFTSPATSRAVLRRRCPPRRVTAPGKTGDVPRALL